MAMTMQQRIMKWFYPLLVWGKQKSTKVTVIKNEKQIQPPVAFYSLSATLNNGKNFSFESLKGKKVLLVNTASDCGFTPQYAELQKLYQHAKEDVEIIGFPANDFHQQEKRSDEEIASFCSVNYGVSFPLAKKSVVVKNHTQHPVYQWLTDKAKNGWNDKAPSWNFSKYLVNEEGILTHYFEPAVSPLGTDVLRAVQE